MRLLRIVVMLSFVALACNNEAYAGLGSFFNKIVKGSSKTVKGGSKTVKGDPKPIRPPRIRGYETCPNCGGSGIIFLDPSSPLMPCMRCGGSGRVSRS